jgi:hypothetical protein
MLSFFRVNALYNLFFLLILLVVIRLPMYLYGLPRLIPELQWMLVGEQINKGFVLYSEIWDNTAPLSALMYAGIDAIVGRSQGAFQIIALVVSLVQVFYFNIFVNERDVFPKRNYVPGLIYLLFLNISFDCCTLSPALMGTTFLLFAFGTLTKQLGRNGATDEVFEAGFYISVASLFYPPAAIFIVWVVISLALFTNASFRQFSLAVFGFLFPLGITTLYFYLNENYEAFLRNFLLSVFQIRQYDLNDFRALLATILLPLGISVMGYFKIIGRGGFVNFQTRTQQIMVLWALAGVLSLVLTPFLAPMQFLVFVPCFAFFTILYFYSIKKNWLSEVIFIGLAGAILFIHYEAVYVSDRETLVSLKNLRLPEKITATNIKNRKVLVLGNATEEYIQNYVATPYLNWSLAQYELERLDNYKHVISILRNFERDYPDYIIDKANLAPRLFKRIPVLERRYRKISEGIYQKVG